jgi:hypothetical protein
MVLDVFHVLIVCTHCNSVCSCCAALCCRIFSVRGTFSIPSAISAVKDPKKLSQLKLTIKIGNK